MPDWSPESLAPYPTWRPLRDRLLASIADGMDKGMSWRKAKTCSCLVCRTYVHLCSHSVGQGDINVACEQVAALDMHLGWNRAVQLMICQ